MSCIELLARLGGDVDTADKGYVSAVQALLRLGADATIMDTNGNTAMDYAILNKQTAVVEAFKAAGVTSARYPNGL